MQILYGMQRSRSWMRGSYLKFLSPIRAADVNKTAADTRRAFTWKMVEGGKAVKARLLEGAFRNLTWKMALWIP